MTGVSLEPIADPLRLADWRRRIAGLYAEIRAAAHPEQAWRHWRRVRDDLLRGHPQSPLPPEARSGFRALPFFDYDPALRFEVEVVSFESGELRYWELGADGTLAVQPFARTEGLVGALGGELTLFWIAGYGGGVFLPFGDATNGAGTYGGGRYLLDGIKGADLGMRGELLILDFNFAYNPSCAYGDTWVCPLAPPENRLPAAVPAGERSAAPSAAG